MAVPLPAVFRPWRQAGWPGSFCVVTWDNVDTLSTVCFMKHVGFLDSCGVEAISAFVLSFKDFAKNVAFIILFQKLLSMIIIRVWEVHFMISF